LREIASVVPGDKRERATLGKRRMKQKQKCKKKKKAVERDHGQLRNEKDRETRGIVMEVMRGLKSVRKSMPKVLKVPRRQRSCPRCLWRREITEKETCFMKREAVVLFA
jgi:hypothetical protein